MLNQKHVIDKKPLNLRLKYELVEALPPLEKNASNELVKLENTFDAQLLSPQQTNYLLGLQGIYNELNNSNLNLFKKTPSPTAEAKQIFSHYVDEEAVANDLLQFAQTDGLLCLPKPTHEVIPLRLQRASNVSRSSIPFFDTPDPSYEFSNLSETPFVIKAIDADQLTESDINYATSVIDHSFQSCFESLDIANKIIDEFSKGSTPTRLAILDTALESSIKPEDKPAVTKSSSEKKKKVSLRLLRHVNLSSKKNQPKLVYQNRPRPPPPKLIKLNSSDQSDEEEKTVKSAMEPRQRISRASKHSNENRSQSTYGHFLSNTYNQLNSSFDDVHDQDLAKPTEDDTDYSDDDSVENKQVVESAEVEASKEDVAAAGATSDLRKMNVKNFAPNKHFKVDLAKKNFQSLYGKHSLSSSIDKLTPVQIDFMQTSKYLNQLRTAYPKLSINLNEKMKNLYFFGTSSHVLEAKERVKLDLGSIKQTTFRLEHPQLAEFLKKSVIKERILKFVETYLNRNNYQGRKSLKSKKIEKDKTMTLVNYCSYEIGSEVVIEITKDTNTIEIMSNTLAVNSNLDYMADILRKFIDDSIKVNKAYHLKSKRLIEVIRKNQPDWLDFYESQFQSIIDVSLRERPSTIHRSQSKTNSGGDKTKWELRMTGFKEDIEKFILEFETKFSIHKPSSFS